MPELDYLNGYRSSGEWENELTRKGFAEALVELGEENPKVVVLDADLAVSTYTKFFRDKFPERFFECGISEQDMMNTAAGLSKMGFIPFLSSYSIFLSGRAWDMMRNTVDYSYCNVKITAAHGGISVGKDGPTHQSMEDVSNTQPLVNMALFLPSDYWEARKVTKFLAGHPGPCYSRLGREKVPTISSEDTPWEFAKAATVLEGTDGTIISNGLMLSRAMMAAEQLAGEGIFPRVLSVTTIKPLDQEAVIKAAAETGGIVIAEECSIFGGLGSTVARMIGESEHLVPIRCVAIREMYLSSGDPYELMDLAGLNVEGVVDAVHDVLKRGKRKLQA
ncbi:transketolase family protein [bacterium]|nr:transketolase family protein [bacterium]